MDSESSVFTRRDFLHTAAIGAAVLAAGPLFQVGAKEDAMGSPMPKMYVCGICGHVEFGMAPESCPVCHAPKEKFTMNNMIFSESAEKFKEAGISHTPVIVTKKEPSLVSDIPCMEIGVRVGKTMHPMEEKHHIQFIDWYENDKFLKRSPLSLQEYPAASIYIKPMPSKVRTVEWCNLHGYWQAEAVI